MLEHVKSLESLGFGLETTVISSLAQSVILYFLNHLNGLSSAGSDYFESFSLVFAEL